MYRRNDPRLQRTLNQLSQNLESANETAQAGLFTFGQNYINPCLEPFSQCLHGCTASCFPNAEDRRRNRGRSRGRAELSFDFYDDWEEEETDSLLGWGNDGLDRLLGGGGYGTTSQPGRERGMSYGNKKGPHVGNRRRGNTHAHDTTADPTIIPSSSYFGFLGKLPWNVGNKGLKYKPSAADLVDHPGAHKMTREEAEPLIEEGEEEGEGTRSHKRNRSGTQSSGHTTDSLSSRGDIFPSEDEIDDAVPLDDEFAMVLERRTTGLSMDEVSSGRNNGKRPSGSRRSTRTGSSRSTRGSKRSSHVNLPAIVQDETIIPTLAELKQEEVQIQEEEEAEVQMKRVAAQKLASLRGLKSDSSHDTSEIGGNPRSPSSDATAQVLEGATTISGNERPVPESPTQEQPELPTRAEKSPDFIPARMPYFQNGPS